MLPDKIQNFVKKLLEKTKKTEISWVYSSLDDTITSDSIEDLEVSIQYRFNPDTGKSILTILFNESRILNKTSFYTDDSYEDFKLLRELFDEAKASNLNLPF